jgi:hypothetical protein
MTATKAVAKTTGLLVGALMGSAFLLVVVVVLPKNSPLEEIDSVSVALSAT